MTVGTRDGRLAPNLLVLALARPKGPRLERREGVIRTARWSRYLDHGLTVACLLDLASEGRIERRDGGWLAVRDASPTGSPPHDLLLRRIAAGEPDALPSTWVVKLAPDAGRAVVVDALERGFTPTTRRVWGVPRTICELVDPVRSAALIEEVRRAYEGTSTDPLAIGLLVLCGTAGLPYLVPGCRRGKELKQRIEALPASTLAASFGDAAAALAVPAAGDPSLLGLWGDIGVLDGGGGFDLGGGGDGA